MAAERICDFNIDVIIFLFSISVVRESTSKIYLVFLFYLCKLREQLSLFQKWNMQTIWLTFAIWRALTLKHFHLNVISLIHTQIIIQWYDLSLRILKYRMEL